MLQRTCEYCGKPFESTYEQDTCSRKCKGLIARRQRQIEIESQFGMPIRELLIDLYHNRQIPVRHIHEHLGVGNHTVLAWFRDLGIQKRSKSEAIALQWVNNDERRISQSERFETTVKAYTAIHGNNAKRPDVAKKISIAKMGAGNAMYGKFGAANPQWKGGKVTYRGRGWRGIRVQVIRRDGGKCRICGSKKGLQVHHITPYRETQDNSPGNLITLCPACHAKAEAGKIILQLPMGLDLT